MTTVAILGTGKMGGAIDRLATISVPALYGAPAHRGTP